MVNVAIINAAAIKERIWAIIFKGERYVEPSGLSFHPSPCWMIIFDFFFGFILIDLPSNTS